MDFMMFAPDIPKREEPRPAYDVKYMKGLVSALTVKTGTQRLRVVVRPTLDCNGIWGDSPVRVPRQYSSKAYAKISMRLVPNQDPDKIEKLFTAYINKITPKSVKVKTYGLHHGKPAITPIESKWIRAAYDSLKQGFGKEPVFIREGGSIPIVLTFKEVLADTVLLAWLTDETHSPDEHLNSTISLRE
jgi:hypothetical protein